MLFSLERHVNPVIVGAIPSEKVEDTKSDIREPYMSNTVPRAFPQL